MGLPLNQVPGDISQKESPTHNHPLSSAPIATRVTTPDQFNALACQRVNREMRKTQADVMPVKPHRALYEYDIVEMILSYLKDQPKALARAMRMCQLFFKAGARILWEDAKPNDLLCIQDTRRRLEFVPFLRNVTLWRHDQVCAAGRTIDPALWRLKALAVYTSGNRTFNSTLLPYLSSTLQKLTVHGDAPNSEGRQRSLLDKGCLVHITATCHRLSVLDLNVVLNVTPHQLSRFFQRMPHLQTLRLGNDLETLLNHDTLSAVFSLSNLKELCLKPSIGQDIAEELVSSHESQRIMPSVTFLEIYFSESNSSAPGDLLRALTTLEGLTMTIHNTSEWPSVLHPNFCDAISNLSSLERLGIHLDRGIDLIDQDLAALYSLQHLTSLGIWSQHGDTDYDVNSLHVSSAYFRDALFVLELIESVSIDLVWTGVLAPDEIQELLERGAASSHNWTLHSIITMGDEAGMGDYGDDEPDEVTPDDVWKGSLKAFSPDPVPWVERDLNIFTNKQGHIMPIEDVASDGSFNYLA